MFVCAGKLYYRWDAPFLLEKPTDRGHAHDVCRGKHLSHTGGLYGKLSKHGILYLYAVAHSNDPFYFCHSSGADCQQSKWFWCHNF